MSKIQIDNKDFELMLNYDQLKKRIRLIAIQLNVVYAKSVPVFIGVLNGGFMFMADLMKEIEIAAEVCFIKIESYKGEEKNESKEIFGLNMNLKGRNVVIVEDIVDTGETMTYLLNEIKKQEPASLAVCTLLLKPGKLQFTVEELAYIGFEIPNDFVVGYGLDYNGLGRNLKDVYKAC